MSTVILGLGNDILSDDGAGILVVRLLKEQLEDDVNIIECLYSGIPLLEVLTGYDNAVIIDSICTNEHPIGTIHLISSDDLSSVISPSPHYAGLPEMFVIADELGLKFPQNIAIYAIEVEDPYTVGGDMHPSVRDAVQKLVPIIKEEIRYLCRESDPVRILVK